MLRWLTLLAAALIALPAVAQDLRPVPALTARVIDQTGTLAAPQAAALEAKLAAFEAETGTQIAVLMVASTLPEDIFDYTQRVGEAWKIGRREVGDGLLVVVAKDDRRVRIAPAKALEGAVPDLAARQIIDRVIRPAFRAGDFAGGLDRAVDQLIGLVKGEALPPPSRDAGAGESGPQLQELLIFFFVAIPILASVLTGMLGRKLGSVATAGAAGGVGWWFTASVLLGLGAALAALLLVGLFGVGSAARSIARGSRHGGPPIIWGGGGDHGGWGGGGFGGIGGGGFSSGGGGDFGGGGASGDW